MGLTITGKVTVYRKDFDNGVAYSISVGSKKQDETYDNAYIPIKFHKGVELQNKQEIDIKDSFFGSYNKKEYIFVKEFEGGEMPSGFEYAQCDEIDTPF